MASELTKLKTLKKAIDKVTNTQDLTARQKLTKYAKKAFDLGWTAHSNKLLCAILKNHATKITNPVTAQRMADAADFIVLHPEWCYEDIFAFFNIPEVGWYPDNDLAREIIKAFANIPFAKKKVKSILQPLYPDIKEQEWF